MFVTRQTSLLTYSVFLTIMLSFNVFHCDIVRAPAVHVAGAQLKIGSTLKIRNGLSVPTSNPCRRL